MPKQPKPLDLHQQELVNIVKAAHRTLAVARKTRTTELARRIAEAKLASERRLERELVLIKMDLDAEVVAHETNLDEALIAAYSEGVPIRRIAFDGFGNRYDGGVQQLLVKLRADGRLGNREGWQRNTDEDVEPTVIFPEPVDLSGILAESTTIAEPTFLRLPSPITLVEADAAGEDGVYAEAVLLTLDSRDPWFKRIEKNARPGTPFLHATTVTLYLHPATGELQTFESRETGETFWDHPVARWVKDHPEEALAGFRVALVSTGPAAVSADDLTQLATLGDQLGIRASEASE